MSSNTEHFNVRRRAVGSGLRKSSTPKTTPPAMGKATPTGSNKPDTKDNAKIKGIIAKYQKIMADEHGYIVLHSLRAARNMVNERSTDTLTDEVSPFKDMPALAVPITNSSWPPLKEKDWNIGRYSVRSIVKQGTLSQELKFQIKGNIAGSPQAHGIPPLPKYHAYVTLRNNILAEDDEVMRYYPYFGDDAADDEALGKLNLEEVFVDKIKNAQEDNTKAEKGIVFVEYVDKFLAELSLDTNAVSSYLIGDLSKTGWSQSRKDIRNKYFPDDFDSTESKIEQAIKRLKPVSTSDLEKAESVCAVFYEILQFSLWEVVQRANEAVRESMAPSRISGGNQGSASQMPGGKSAADAVARLTGGNPQPYSVESYAALNCLYCYMHECPFHGQLTDTGLTLVNNNKDSVLLYGNGPKPTTTTPGSRKHAFTEGAECSEGCFIKATEEDRAKRTVWSKAQSQFLQAAGMVLRENPRASCLIASVVNKYCYEIEAEMQRRGLLAVPMELPVSEVITDLDSLDSNHKAPLKRKRPNVKGNYGDYPVDCHKTLNSNERSYFKPCLHTGPCNSECPCVKDKVMCEKSCMCDADCPRKWRGCKCAASGKACSINTNCPCVRWNRECDPDICTQCGAAETLSPTNRYDLELAKECCQNVVIQRDIPKRTLLGVSGVSGLGLFVGEAVKKDGFLGEYKGEIISNDEAERRGKLYDRRGVSFLFTLNKTQVIDATRAGNKFRFVNHYKKPNCFARVLFTNCTHRIGMFAMRDLVPGEELYFDYGYNNKSSQFIAREPDFVFQPGARTSGEKVQKKNRITNRGNWDTGHTARTSMKKLLKESSINGATSNMLTTTLPFQLGSRSRTFSTTRGSFNTGHTGTNTPSITDAASDTPGDDRSRLSSRIGESEEELEDSDDEPLVRGRDRTRTWGLLPSESSDARNQSISGWEIEASNDEEEDEDEDGDDDEETNRDDDDEQSDVRNLGIATGDDDDDEEEEEEYAPSRRVRNRMRDRVPSTSASKRRKLA